MKVRNVDQVRHAPSLPMPEQWAPIELSALCASEADARNELLRRLRRFGCARLRAPPDTVEAVRSCFEAAPQFFSQSGAAKRALRSNLEAENSRYSGYANDLGREWLQLRKQMGCGGKCLPAGVPTPFENCYERLSAAAADCLRALALALNVPEEEWLRLTDLGAAANAEGRRQATRLHNPRDTVAHGTKQGGPSVLRLYASRCLK